VVTTRKSAFGILLKYVKRFTQKKNVTIIFVISEKSRRNENTEEKENK